MKNNVKVVVVLNKLDRLVIELKLPLMDAYYKLKYTLDELNMVVATHSHGKKNQKFFNPVNGNVVFASTQFGCCFSLQSFAALYGTKIQTQESYSRHS